MQKRDLQVRRLRLLREEDMQQLREELADRYQDRAPDNLQGLLGRHEQEEEVQEKAETPRSSKQEITSFNGCLSTEMNTISINIS
jgi:hypothetical protein